MGHKKGGVPFLLGFVAVVGVIFFFIFDTAGIFDREFEAALKDKETYSTIHHAEFFKRTIDSGVWYSGRQAVYTVAENIDWDTKPSDEEVLAVLKTEVSESSFTDEKIWNVSISTGELNIDIKDVSDSEFIIYGNQAFDTDFVQRNFQVSLENSGDFERKIKTNLFEAAQLVREKTCAQNEKIILKNADVGLKISFEVECVEVG